MRSHRSAFSATVRLKRLFARFGSNNNTSLFYILTTTFNCHLLLFSAGIETYKHAEKPPFFHVPAHTFVSCTSYPILRVIAHSHLTLIQMSFCLIEFFRTSANSSSKLTLSILISSFEIFPVLLSNSVNMIASR